MEVGILKDIKVKKIISQFILTPHRSIENLQNGPKSIKSILSDHNLVWWVIGVPKTLRVIKWPRKRSILHRLGFIAQKHQFFDVFVIFPKKPNFLKIFDYISKTVRDRAFLRPFDDP